MDSNSPCKYLLFPRGPNSAQKPLYLVGTVLNIGLMCDYVTLKIHLQASFARHFLKLSLPSCYLHVGILSFIFTALRIDS